MKISSNPQLFQTISTFSDAKKVQDQALQERQEQKQPNNKQVDARDLLKEDLIRQNRDAIQQTQETLRQQRLSRLQDSQNIERLPATENTGQPVNLNLRENPGAGSVSPSFVKLGQFVDIRV